MGNKIGWFLLSILPITIPFLGMEYVPSIEASMLLISFVLSVFSMNRINRKFSIFYGIVGAVLYTLYLLPKPVDINYFRVSNSKNRYYIYNTCFLYCNVVIYKKVPYFPLMYFYQDGGDLSIKKEDYEIIKDSIYLHTPNKAIVLP